MRLKEDNRGITLIELILSMALLVIIMGVVMLLMRSASQGFSQAQVQITLQEEAQDAMNYMTDTILASNDAAIVSSAGLTGIIFYDYDKTAKTDVTKSPYKVFVKHRKKLYFYSVYDATTLSDWQAVEGGADPDSEHLLCRNVEEFNVEYTQPQRAGDIPKVKFGLRLESGKPTVKYTVSNTVVMRNQPASLVSVAPVATPTTSPTASPGAITPTPTP